MHLIDFAFYWRHICNARILRTNIISTNGSSTLRRICTELHLNNTKLLYIYIINTELHQINTYQHLMHLGLLYILSIIHNKLLYIYQYGSSNQHLPTVHLMHTELNHMHIAQHLIHTELHIIQTELYSFVLVCK